MNKRPFAAVHGPTPGNERCEVASVKGGRIDAGGRAVRAGISLISRH